MTKLRLAIVGAGPAGIYAADILLKAERKFDVSIDLFEQLPAPYGLVRYGVAPDHPRIKGIVTALRDLRDRGRPRRGSGHPRDRRDRIVRRGRFRQLVRRAPRCSPRMAVGCGIR